MQRFPSVILALLLFTECGFSETEPLLSEGQAAVLETKPSSESRNVEEAAFDPEPLSVGPSGQEAETNASTLEDLGTSPPAESLDAARNQSPESATDISPEPQSFTLREVNETELNQMALRASRMAAANQSASSFFVVMFQTSTCQFSREAFPAYMALTNTFPTIQFVYIEVSRYRGLIGQYWVLGTPTIAIFNGSDIAARFHSTRNFLSLVAFVSSTTGHEAVPGPEFVPPSSPPPRDVDPVLWLSAATVLAASAVSLWRQLPRLQQRLRLRLRGRAKRD